MHFEFCAALHMKKMVMPSLARLSRTASAISSTQFHQSQAVTESLGRKLRIGVEVWRDRHACITVRVFERDKHTAYFLEIGRKSTLVHDLPGVVRLR